MQSAAKGLRSMAPGYSCPLVQQPACSSAALMQACARPPTQMPEHTAAHARASAFLPRPACSRAAIDAAWCTLSLAYLCVQR